MTTTEVDWDRTVFVLLAPDAVARQLAGPILDRLLRLSYRPIAWRVLWHRPADLDAFHEQNIAHSWQAYLYRLVDQLFAFGPTVALLARDDRPDGAQTSHERLRRAKGASEPSGAAPGTIRGDLGSINVMLALMHSADTTADARREYAVFSGPDGFASGEPEDLRTQVGLLELSGPAEERGFAEVLSGLRARLLAAVWEELAPASRRKVATILAGGARRLVLPGAGDRLAALLPPAHPLASVLRTGFTPESPGPDLARIHPLLRLYGTGLDRWEELVLATSRRFAPRLPVATETETSSAAR